jgi:hypothetical protein
MKYGSAEAINLVHQDAIKPSCEAPTGGQNISNQERSSVSVRSIHVKTGEMRDRAGTGRKV